MCFAQVKNTAVVLSESVVCLSENSEVEISLVVCSVNLATMERAFRELGHHRDQSNEVLQVVEVEAILSKVFNNAREDGGGYNYSLVYNIQNNHSLPCTPCV